MGNYDFTVGELVTMIKRESKMNVAQLGNTTLDQNNYIYSYMTQALWKYAGLIFHKRISDVLPVTDNGYVTFKIDAVDITDMYAPTKILVAPEVSGKTFIRRTSFDAPTGWFKESANDPIHIKGAGEYILHYRSYHAKITTENQPLEIPQTSYRLIQYETLALIFHSLNQTDSALAMQAITDKEIPIMIKANMDSSQATTGGIVPSQNEAQYYRR